MIPEAPQHLVTPVPRTKSNSTAQGVTRCCGASGIMYPEVAIPPTLGLRSTTMTRFPARDRYPAAVMPLWPAPTITTSASSVTFPPVTRSEERRVGKECVSTCSSRWSQFHYKKKQNTINKHILIDITNDNDI